MDREPDGGRPYALACGRNLMKTERERAKALIEAIDSVEAIPRSLVRQLRELVTNLAAAARGARRRSSTYRRRDSRNLRAGCATPQRISSRQSRTQKYYWRSDKNDDDD